VIALDAQGVHPLGEPAQERGAVALFEVKPRASKYVFGEFAAKIFFDLVRRARRRVSLRQEG
jgi:hypothetical protein